MGMDGLIVTMPGSEMSEIESPPHWLPYRVPLLLAVAPSGPERLPPWPLPTVIAWRNKAVLLNPPVIAMEDYPPPMMSMSSPAGRSVIEMSSPFAIFLAVVPSVVER